MTREQFELEADRIEQAAQTFVTMQQDNLGIPKTLIGYDRQEHEWIVQMEYSSDKVYQWRDANAFRLKANILAGAMGLI